MFKIFATFICNLIYTISKHYKIKSHKEWSLKKKSGSSLNNILTRFIFGFEEELLRKVGASILILTFHFHLQQIFVYMRKKNQAEYIFIRKYSFQIIFSKPYFTEKGTERGKCSV